MASFAMLTTDWEVGKKSYLDNFVGFAVGAITAKGLQKFRPSDVRDAMGESYGILLPEKVIAHIVKRAGRQKLVTSVGNGQYVCSSEGVQVSEKVPTSHQQFERELKNLEQDFKSWAFSNWNIDLSAVEAAKALLEYIETYYGSLMSSATGSGSIGKLPTTDPAEETRAVAAYISHLFESQPEKLNYVLNVAKGSMLVAALFAPDPVRLDRPFRGTKLVLDTRVVLQLLGYEGTAAANSAADYVNLTRTQGGKFVIFDFTLQEVEMILRSAERAASAGTLWQWRLGSVGSHFYENEFTAGDITLQITSLKEKLASAQIEVIASPAYSNHKLVVDENLIEKEIRDLSLYQSESALLHDVKALAAIVRMRNGLAKDNLEESRAVFVTTNSNILRASRKVQDLRSEPYFVAILDTDLATLTWIKTPPAAPELPRRALLATCWSVLKPSELTWAKYIKELEQRHKKGDLTDAELIVVRQRFEQDRVKMSIHSLQSDDEIETAITLTVAEARKTIISELSQPYAARENKLRDTVQELDVAGRKAEKEVSSLNRQISEAAARVDRLADATGAVAKWVLFACLGGMLVAGAFLTNLSFPWDVLSKIILLAATFYGGLHKPGQVVGKKLSSMLRPRFHAYFGTDASSANQ